MIHMPGIAESRKIADSRQLSSPLVEVEPRIRPTPLTMWHMRKRLLLAFMLMPWNTRLIAKLSLAPAFRCFNTILRANKMGIRNEKLE